MVEWVVQPVTARAAAKMTALMIRTGRMGTSPVDCATGVVHQQRGPGRSRQGRGRASRQQQDGLDRVAILNQKDHDAARD
jgi:hypothetical protein